MTVTKTSKTPPREYQTWAAASADFVPGDIIDVSASLGGRTPDSVTIESPDGDSSVMFNVTQRVFKNHKEMGNTSIPYAGFYQSPLLQDEIEVTSPTITIGAGDRQT